jgi:hypothetical protein
LFTRQGFAFVTIVGFVIDLAGYAIASEWQTLWTSTGIIFCINTELISVIAALFFNGFGFIGYSNIGDNVLIFALLDLVAFVVTTVG